MYSTRYSCPILMKLEFSRHIFEKNSNMKFRENPSSRSLVVPRRLTDGQTYMTNLIAAFAILRSRLKLETILIKQ